MAASNAQIAAVFGEIADILQLQNANPFRIRAYRQAAETVGHWPDEIAPWLDGGHALDELPGIGTDLAQKIREILATGTCEALREMRQQVPTGVTELLAVPGLGAQRVRILRQELEITSPQHLLRAALEGQVRSVPGFGAASERRIIEAVRAYLGADADMTAASDQHPTSTDERSKPPRRDRQRTR